MLLSIVIFSAVGLPLAVHTSVEGLVSNTSTIILRFANIILHSWKEKLVAHGRVEARKRPVLVRGTALRVPLLSRITHAILHKDLVRILIRPLLSLSHFNALVQEMHSLVIFFLQLRLETLILHKLQPIHLELMQLVTLRR